jgi:hypothetical protein
VAQVLFYAKRAQPDAPLPLQPPTLHAHVSALQKRPAEPPPKPPAHAVEAPEAESSSSGEPPAPAPVVQAPKRAAKTPWDAIHPPIDKPKKRFIRQRRRTKRGATKLRRRRFLRARRRRRRQFVRTVDLKEGTPPMGSQGPVTVPESRGVLFEAAVGAEMRVSFSSSLW